MKILAKQLKAVRETFVYPEAEIISAFQYQLYYSICIAVYFHLLIVLQIPVQANLPLVKKMFKTCEIRPQKRYIDQELEDSITLSMC